jgi:hypothetical protein
MNTWPLRVLIDGRELFIYRRPTDSNGVRIDGQILGDVYAWQRGARVEVLEVTR